MPNFILVKDIIETQNINNKNKKSDTKRFN